jgi:hypothetical protein
MKIGFTGTRYSMTINQRVVLRQDLLPSYGPGELHHGDCVGADAQAHQIACAALFRIISHPPTNPVKRAFCKADEEREPRPYLERNYVIVRDTELLIACPGELTEQLRSGTWSTVRYARRLGRPVVLVFPDGTVKRERCG